MLPEPIESVHLDEMTPREIVRELDKYVIGQAAATRAVAIALEKRWRLVIVRRRIRVQPERKK